MPAAGPRWRQARSLPWAELRQERGLAPQSQHPSRRLAGGYCLWWFRLHRLGTFHAASLSPTDSGASWAAGRGCALSACRT